jgi:hypothetical protein
LHPTFVSRKIQTSILRKQDAIRRALTIAKHFPKDEDSKEGYYNNGRLIQSGKKIYNK